MYSPKISIIIPIFKVEEYLKDCVDSVIQQTYTNLEIILVNDGSPDNCGAICDAYAKQDARITVIHKENGGLSDARNAGLDICTGDYIAFVDSDDVVHPRFIEILYFNLIQNKSDVVICSILNFDDTLEIPEILFDYKVLESWNREMFRHNIINSNYLPQVVTVWSKLYSKYFFDTLRFKKNRFHEDEFILHEIVELTNKCIYVNLPLYFYRNTASGIMRNRLNSSKKTHDAILCFSERIEFYKNNNLLEFANVLNKKLVFYKICKYLNDEVDLNYYEKIKYIKFVLFSKLHYKSKLLYFLKILSF